MKLTNPTDLELDAAFATEVAGWKCIEGYWAHPDCPPEMNLFSLSTTPPAFTQSADAVLPWLEKHYLEAKYWSGAAGERPCWRIGVEGEPMTRKSGQGDGQGFAKAAVLALLRAHNIEVEFT